MYKLNIVSKEDKELFRDYFNKYLCELSQYDKNIEFNENVPVYEYFDYYFIDDDRYPFWLYKNNDLIGIALVRKVDDNYFEISEFTIFENYRKDNNSLNSASLLVDYFDGDFCFSTDLNNIIAVKFWDKFSKKYNHTITVDNYRKEWVINK